MFNERKSYGLLTLLGILTLTLYVLLETKSEFVVNLLSKFDTNTAEWLAENSRLASAVLNPVAITLLLTGIIEYLGLCRKYNEKIEEMFTLLVWCKYNCINLLTPQEVSEQILDVDSNRRIFAYGLKHKPRLLSLNESAKKAYQNFEFDDLIKTPEQDNARNEIRKTLWKIILKTDTSIECCERVLFRFNGDELKELGPNTFLDDIDTIMNLYINNFLFGMNAENAKEIYNELWADRVEQIKNEKAKNNTQNSIDS
ncbi:MAG: hypothetical protein E7062_10700 [Spirochaetaceae bacterium]|nr:hypothetical protein [Spirochaetaceae bacterium]